MGTPLKIGLFGGTFDPIHFGHINFAIEIKERAGLDEVWFIPAKVAPLRDGHTSAPEKDRLAMLRLALQDIPFFKISEVELHRPAPSYTIDTIEEILKTHTNQNFYLLLGEDAIASFQKWKEPEKIVKKIPLLIGSRHGSSLKDLGFPEIQKGIIQTPLFDISATEIRQRIKKRLYCNHLLPSKVVDYIYENQLYFNS